MRTPFAAGILFFAAGCAALAPAEPVPVLLLGEQHDAPEHQRKHREVIQQLAERRHLAAVVVEMAQQGRSTAGLPPTASEEQVRQALGWNSQAWPWEAYGPAVMAAVRSGVPVRGSNLSQEEMRAAMRDTSLDDALPPAALQAQRQAIREGHCNALPDAQIPGMTRVQIARDRAMARAISEAVTRGKSVVMLAGAGHVQPELGVPRHLPRGLRAETLVLPRVDTGKDYCAEFRRSLPATRQG